MDAVASILDPVQPTLSPYIWEHPEAPEPFLKPKVASFIKRTIYRALERHGYSSPNEWLRLCLTGSLTTYQYADDSDCDISLFVDSAVFPEWSRSEMIGIMISEVDGGNAVIPGTPYPLQCFVVARKFQPSDLYKPGLRSGYDIDAGRWIVPPEKERSHDIQAQEYGAYAYGLQVADKMERLLRYEPDKAELFWHQIHARRMRDQAAGKGDYCLAPETRVLTTDYAWTPVGELEVGDQIVGFDEEVEGGRRRGAQRKLRRAVVIASERKMLPSYRVITDANPEVVASAKHRWLVRGAKRLLEWRTTDELEPGDQIIRFGLPWDEPTDPVEAAYLAGLMDGEGHLTAAGRLYFTQNEGMVMERAKHAFHALGFDYGLCPRSSQGRPVATQLQVRGGVPEAMRFLHQVPTVRLRSQRSDFWVGRDLSPKNRYVTNGVVATVIGIEPLGDREVVAVETSTRTLIAEGLYSHNSDSNIVYKFLAKRGLLPEIAQLTGEHIAAGPVVKHRLDWQPGAPGKGFILQDGSVWTWPTDRMRPQHSLVETRSRMDGAAPVKRGTEFHIEPHGRVWQFNRQGDRPGDPGFRSFDPDDRFAIMKSNAGLWFGQPGDTQPPNVVDDGYGHATEIMPKAPAPVTAAAPDTQAMLDANAGTDLQGLPGRVNVPGYGPLQFHGNADIQRVANEYNAANGLGAHPTDYVPVDPQNAAQIAAEYERMEHNPQDPRVAQAYQALANESMAQYRHAVNNGYRFEFYPEGQDPYPNSPREAVMDLHRNKHMYVYPTEVGYGQEQQGMDHPLLQDSGERWGGRPVTYNDIFRAIHDFYGHAKEGLGFRAHGEDNAYRQHAAMFSPAARQALASETRGQNSYVNYGPMGEHNQTANQAETVYAPQKAGLMPDWVSDPSLHQQATFARTAASDIANTAFQATLANGGITVGLDGTQPNSGFAYSPAKSEESIVPLTALTPQTIDDFINDHYRLLRQPGYYLGMWVDGQDVYLDVSVVHPDRDSAMQQAQQANQLAMYDLSTFDEIPVGTIARVAGWGDDDAPMLYHQCDAAEAQRILQVGLDPKYDQTGEGGVYLSDTPADLDAWETKYPETVGKRWLLGVDTTGLHVEPDPVMVDAQQKGLWPGKEHWSIVRDRIPPERIHVIWPSATAPNHV